MTNTETVGTALAAAEKFVTEYEWDDGESGHHVPTEFEQAMMLDMVNGLFVDDDFLSALEIPPLHKEGEATGYVSERSFDYLNSGQINGAAMIEPSKTRLATIPLYAAPVPVPVTITPEIVERVEEQIAHVRLGVACRAPDITASTLELIARVEALTAALSQKPGEQG